MCDKSREFIDLNAAAKMMGRGPFPPEAVKTYALLDQFIQYLPEEAGKINICGSGWTVRAERGRHGWEAGVSNHI